MENRYFLLRKLLHTLFGIVVLFIALEAWVTLKEVIFRWLLVGALLFFLFLDYLRLDWHAKLPLYRETQKPKERNHLHALTLGAIGTIFSFLLFDFTIAIAALAMQYFGDPAAAIVGKYFGKTRLFRSKTLQGTLAMLIVSIVAGYAFLTSWRLIVPMAVAATLAELFTDKMDDNLVVPIVTGAVGMFLAVLWQVS